MKKSLVFTSVLAFAACSGGEAPQAPAPQAPAAAAQPAAPAVDPNAYKELDAVPSAGTVTGTITYTGKEKDTSEAVTKDQQACCVGGECKNNQRPAQTLVVKGGKLANAIIYIEGIKEGKKWPTEPALLDNMHCRFDPRVVIGQKGGKVAAKNSDPMLHNTHLYQHSDNKDLINIALPEPGKTIEKPLKKGGIISVKCDAHEWMQGWVYSGENPYAAVSGADGTFKLEQVPAGEYTVKIWHERLGEKEAKVTVTAGGSATVAVAYN